MSDKTDLPNDLDELKGLVESLRAKCDEQSQIIDSYRSKEDTQVIDRQASTRAVESSVDATPINEADQTLRRLVQRIAMILQAEKIVIMFHDRERGELIGIPPAYGVEEDRLTHFRVRATHGISGKVFRESSPMTFKDAMTDPAAKEDPFSLIRVENGITVPLVIEKRDEENRIIDRTTIGVLHAFNKRHGEEFNEEDIRLLERMARNVGSIIANLQLYREVVEEREELLQTFESLTAGLILVSPEGRISQINASARQLFAVQGEAIGQSYDKVTNPDVRTFFASYLDGKEPGKIETTSEVGGSTRILEMQGATVNSEEGKQLGVVAIVNDITEMRNIDKMKSSFVAMASHELRTPLTAIKGFVRTLLDGEEYFGREDRHEFHTIIDSECDRLRRLIDDLLNTARIESGESLRPNYTRFELLPLVEKAIMIQTQATKKHELVLDVQNELPGTIIGDEDKLDQILTNLLNNAIKYSHGGEIRVSVKRDGDYVLFGVHDQGLGIPKDHLTKVFERFHRVNNEDNRKIYGTGLGLYLVHHLVEQVHLGKVWAESEVGVGSTFWFKIPVELDIEKAKELND
ncbi:MAG TPA: ATP-binding protein [Fimbriimonadaceae bacterium]|nr:ATP-binding protein [Fimbriimonadaceae bacterium]